MSRTINVTEKYQSQIPAMQLLVNLGFEPLSQKKITELRGGKLNQVLLEDILEERLLKLNHFLVKDEVHFFDIEDAEEAIRRLKPTPDQLSNLRRTNQDMYDLLTLGTVIQKNIGGDKKSYSFRYIDWENPANNAYHVAAEFSVARTASGYVRRCDIVCFVNGIPFIVIENKSPAISLKKAESQLIGYQKEDGIPHLFYYAQLLLTLNRAEGKYATVGSSSKYWNIWKDEKDSEDTIFDCINKPLNALQKDVIFSGDFAEARAYFDEIPEDVTRLVTVQDSLLYGLCRPERLLDMIRRFTVFDGSIRKIARHPQYFSVLETIARAKKTQLEGNRKGGVVWHTQGSGKSLTMVMLARALAMEFSIKNRRIIIVTDRKDLDEQIKNVFTACDMKPVRAKSGQHLLTLIENHTPLVTTVINKFEKAFALQQTLQNDADLFVLVDESHRTQSGKYTGFGTFAGKMRKMLPKACYIGFTGTPILKKDKSTLEMFGGIIHQYTISDAVADGAVVPLFYEGRLVEQKISGSTIDQWFEKYSEESTDEEKRALKRRFSRLNKVNTSLQVLQAKAFDISEDFRKNWKGTGFKAQLVAPSKIAAIQMKAFLDEIGDVSSEIIISPPDQEESNEDIHAESVNKVSQFWKKMMDLYGNETKYNEAIIERFKQGSDPDILIVVSKLLTGFDAPRNTVLYICKSLKEHSLLQAIARVNRLFDEDGQEKEFGLIVDYEGLLGELSETLTAYNSFSGYEAKDLAGALYPLSEIIEKLPQLHENLWDVFKTLPNKRDMESFEQYLADIAVRETFYERLKIFGRGLHMALSSGKVYEIWDKDHIENLKSDLSAFFVLKKRVQNRYQEMINIKDYEPRIQKLLDNHLSAEPAITIVERLDITAPGALEKAEKEEKTSSASKADRIASATKRTITESMALDPTFYKRFSELLEETIADYRANRLSEDAYLKKTMEIARKVVKKDQGDKYLPAIIAKNEDGIAFYGVLESILKPLSKSTKPEDEVAEIALQVIQIIKKHYVVNLWSNSGVQGDICDEMDDYFCDICRDKKGYDISGTLLAELEKQIMQLARARFP